MSGKLHRFGARATLPLHIVSIVIISTLMSESLGFLLSDSARLLRRKFAARVRTIGVTRTQWRVLLLRKHTERPEDSTVGKACVCRCRADVSPTQKNKTTN